MLLAGLIFVAAVIFSAVGLGGASGYLAAMALVGVAPETMRPASLVLNVLVSAINTWQFGRAGAIHWRLLWPLAVWSTPAAFIGGMISLPESVYRPLISATLLWTAWRLARSVRPAPPAEMSHASAAMIGGLVGFLAGLTGVGGGLFLAPAMLLMGWADERTTAGTTSAFIVLNSAAALLGTLTHDQTFPSDLPLMGAAAMAGAVLGSWLAAHQLSKGAIRYLLVAVLVASAARFLMR